MWNLDSIGLETAFNIMRILGFLLICLLGGVAWLIYFLIQEQKNPVAPPLDINLITREALRIAHEKAAFIGTVDHAYDEEYGEIWSFKNNQKSTIKVRRHNSYFSHANFQNEIATRWANPDYEVVGKARRVPFSQQKLDEDHGEALGMVAAGGNLTAPYKTTRHFKLRTPVPQVNVDIAHIEALKMIRRGEYA